MSRIFSVTLFSVVLALAACSSGPASVQAVERPRLVVVISVDQFRADYMTRFADDYLPAKNGDKVGGFRFLTESGANYINCHFMHAQTVTGAGHAVIMTGSVPSLNGVVGNNWYDRTVSDIKKRRVYCVDDPGVTTVGGSSRPMGPLNLRVTTVGDELKMATNGKGKVVGIALKDRAAVLMAGHAADSAVWFETENSSWVSSTHYAPTGKLPSWAAAINQRKIPQSMGSRTWTPLLPESAYWKARPAPFTKTGSPMFSHRVSEDFFGSGLANEFVFETVNQAVLAEALGQDDVPDVLVIGLSSNDYVGHQYGPNSPEVMDVCVRTDRLLSEFFNMLEKKIPGGLSRVVIALTSDHGVVPIVEETRDTYKLRTVEREAGRAINAAVEAAMDAKYGAATWVEVGGTSLYLNRDLLVAKKIDIADAQRTAARAASTVKGVYCSFAAVDVMEGRLPMWPWIERVYNGFSPTLSPDVLSFESPGFYDGGGTGTGHGVPWAYDTHVPMVVWGGAVRPGTFTETVSVSDLAPTLSAILGIEQPSGCVGRPLSALGK